MHQARADRLEHSGQRAAALRVGGQREGPARPAWRILGWTLGIAMALWATGIVELPASLRRLIDSIGALTVLAVLVLWVRLNARSLAALSDPPDRDDRVSVRLIRSRRPPLAVGGPDVKPLHRSTGRVSPS